MHNESQLQMKEKISSKAKLAINTVRNSLAQFDIDKVIEQLKLCRPLGQKDLKYLCKRAKQLFQKEDNVVDLHAPITICGDIHGQYPDLVQLMDIGGKIGKGNFLFLGDYVDRGHYSVETISILFAYKVKYPDKVTLLRGNHQSRMVSKQYGFYDQALQKYGSSDAWSLITDVFDFMPICALIDKLTLCMHGGLSPSIQTIDEIRKLNRFQQPGLEGPITDLLWSDPNMKPGYNPNVGRGIGYTFGQDVSQKFTHRNKIKCITRAHEICMSGYDIIHNKKVMTIFSAPNYCYRCGNKGSVLELDSKHHGNFLVFGHTSQFDENDPQKQVPKYFT